MIVSTDHVQTSKATFIDFVEQGEELGCIQENDQRRVLEEGAPVQCVAQAPPQSGVDVVPQGQEPKFQVLLAEDKQHQLSQALVAGTLGVIPIQPNRVHDVSPPQVQVHQVDGHMAEVKVTQTFRVQLGESNLNGGATQQRYHSTCQILDVDGGSPPSSNGATKKSVPHKEAGAHKQEPNSGKFFLNNFKWQLSDVGQQLVTRNTDAWALVPQSTANEQEQDVLLGKKLVSLCDGLMVYPPWNQSSHAPAPGSLRVWELDPDKILLGRRVAMGGFAEVFIGKYEGTVVAVKRLFTQQSPGVEARFVHEVSMLASLRHPNLILFMGYCTHPALCIVSEFMSKGSLHHILQQHPQPLLPQQQRLVAISVARGMAYLHTRNPPILHLDLKSPNILVDGNWRVKVADFGLSKVRRGRMHFSGMSGGTTEWQAPEVIRGESFGEAADVYSYGVVLWELLTGQPPWDNMLQAQIVAAVAFQQQRLPRPTSGDPFLCDLCQACMNPNPSQRPTFPDIMMRLEEHYGQSPLSNSIPLSSISSSEGSNLLPPYQQLALLPPTNHRHSPQKPAAETHSVSPFKKVQHQPPHGAITGSLDTVDGDGVQHIQGDGPQHTQGDGLQDVGPERQGQNGNSSSSGSNTLASCLAHSSGPQNDANHANDPDLSQADLSGSDIAVAVCNTDAGLVDPLAPVIEVQQERTDPDRMETDNSSTKEDGLGPNTVDEMSLTYLQSSLPAVPSSEECMTVDVQDSDQASMVLHGVVPSPVGQPGAVWNTTAVDTLSITHAGLAATSSPNVGLAATYSPTAGPAATYSPTAGPAATYSPTAGVSRNVCGSEQRPDVRKDLSKLSPFVMHAGTPIDAAVAGSVQTKAAVVVASNPGYRVSPFAAPMFQIGFDDSH